MTTKLLWNDSFSVGVSELDSHHQHLARLINKLAEYPHAEDCRELLSEAISGLVQYASYHFKVEESLMAEHGFPHEEKHRGEHTKFCEIIAEISFGATLGIIKVSELVEDLNLWWTNHILREDMRLKPFFAARGVK